MDINVAENEDVPDEAMETESPAESPALETSEEMSQDEQDTCEMECEEEMVFPDTLEGFKYKFKG